MIRSLYLGFSTLFVLACLLSGCGGGSSSSNGIGDAVPAPAAPEPDPILVSGAAVKGIIRAGSVEVFEVMPSGGLSGVVGTATTNAQGAFTAELSPAYAGGPLKIEVTAVAGTRMICDVPDGCGGAAFGEELELEPGFRMSAVMPAPVGTSISAAVTPLSDMAAKRAQADPAGLSAASIQSANDVVRQTFNLPGDIVQVTPLDITDPAAVAGASNTAKRVALFAAAIADAVSRTDAVSTGAAPLGAGLEAFTDAYAAGGGIVLNDTELSEDRIVGLDDILAAMNRVIDAVQSRAESEGVDVALAGVGAAVAMQIARLPEERSDDPDTSVLALDTITTDKLTRARNAVSAVHDVLNGLDRIDPDSGFEVFAASDAIGGHVDPFGGSGSSGGDLLLLEKSFARALDALAHASAAFERDTDLQEFEFDSITVDIDATFVDPEFEVFFTIDEEVGGTAIFLQALAIYVPVAEAADVQIQTSSAQEVVLQGAIEFFDATAEKDELLLEVIQGALEIVPEVAPATSSNGDTVTITLGMTVRLTKAVSPPIVFNGTFDLNLTGVNAGYITKHGADDRVVVNTSKKNEFTFETLTLAIEGVVTNGADLNGNVAINLDLTNPHGLTFDFKDLFDIHELLGLDGNLIGKNTGGGYADKFLEGTFTFAFTGFLPGVADLVNVLVLIERNGAEHIAVIEIIVGDLEVTIEIDFNTGEIIITTPDGVTIVGEKNKHGKFEGTVSVDGEQVGVAEERDGSIIVEFQDGSLDVLA